MGSGTVQLPVVYDIYLAGQYGNRIEPDAGSSGLAWQYGSVR